ncbi:SAM-dependent methyltransferase [Taklimakanibacter deserti]|uniref:SAM-dependent methyltransferase n=1 Tax=Taklimakanibacter deserti TaxID=2267839 RepID=UPI000E65142A
MGTDFALKPAPMEGKGAYNRHSGVQQAGASPALPLWEEAAARVVLPPAAEPIVIADYGSSQGHSSFGQIGAAIHAIRQRTGPSRPISVVHNDLPASDFSTLFEALASDPDSYLKQDPASFASAVGRSFYEQVLPPASVTLGWSSWAVQWLSRAPAPIPDQVHISVSADKTVRDLYERQSAEDWRAFLAHRADELRPGGRLVVLTMALTPDGDFGYGPILAAMYDALRQAVRQGFISEAELNSMAIPTVGRGLAQLKHPFDDGRFAGLSLDHAEVFSGPDPIWEGFERDRDAKAYGARWAAFSRASVLPTLAAALGGATDRRTDFIARIENGMATRLAAAPEKFPIPLGLVAVSKDR